MATPQDADQLDIIDSHVHLWPASEASSLAWRSSGHALPEQQSVEQYRAATGPQSRGFIMIEADRVHDLAKDEWAAPLDEVRWMRRIALGEPREGEGHTAADASACVGLVPWAPLPRGVAVMERYLAEVQEAAGQAWPKIKAFRYLLQDKPTGTMVDKDFIDGLKLLGRRGFAFEVGVDQHQRGKKHLEEVLTMADLAHQDVPEEQRVTFIIDHLGKPDLGIYNVTSDPGFTSWRGVMYSLSKAPNIYVKLSGAFSEMPASLRDQPPAHIFESLLAWFGVVLATFGPNRLMFASDWPMCSMGGPADSWDKWRQVVEKVCWMASLSDLERLMIFGGTARNAYRM